MSGTSSALLAQLQAMSKAAQQAPAPAPAPAAAAGPNPELLAAFFAQQAAAAQAAEAPAPVVEPVAAAPVAAAPVAAAPVPDGVKLPPKKRGRKKADPVVEPAPEPEPVDDVEPEPSAVVAIDVAAKLDLLVTCATSGLSADDARGYMDLFDLVTNPDGGA